jgi:excisionase family DNA binding protein
MKKPLVIEKRLGIGPAAQIVGVHSSTLRKLARDGLIAHYQIGEKLYFTEHELRTYVEKCFRPAKAA